MNPLTTARANDAIKRSNRDKARGASNVPIFADILIDGDKIGHIVSDGYSNNSWSFYPTELEGRKERRMTTFDNVLPKWVTKAKAQIGEFETSCELTAKHEAKKTAAYREALLKDAVYTAIDGESFPCNPIPFANALAEHVREFGTDSIKSDDAKKILWILMGQAYGQLGTIDLSDEWDRLTKRGGTSA